MEGFVTKQEKKLYKALQSIIGHCVDRIGLPKKPTARQIRQALRAIYGYEEYIRNNKDKVRI